MKYQNIREEELKIKVRDDYFPNFNYSIIGNIDFCISLKNKNTSQTALFDIPSLLWAEAKTGDYNVVDMFVQLILTIGKARTFDKYLPPAFLGAFDFKKIAFVPYNLVSDIFYLNDFNWNVTPSNHETKEFKLIKDRIENTLQKDKYQFDFVTEEKLLLFFIKNNIGFATQDAKIAIDKNNFVSIYLRWLEQVKPCIDLDWASVKKNVLDSDFYLADLFVDDKGTNTIDDDTPLSDSLMVVFKDGHYQIQNKYLDGVFKTGHNSFALKDKNTYEQFWKKYKRPPLEKFQNFILERKDLLVPQDIRERRGAFFTPKKWVELSQKYIAEVLGEDWQEEYYVWDCAAGTGNLLFGLTNPYNIWASTLDQSDVNVMHESIDNGTSILLKNHVFQFDFLNDDFAKLPDPLQAIINNPEKRKKLLIYINPPYAEAPHRSFEKDGKSGVEQSFVNKKYAKILGQGNRELFIQFFTRINQEIKGCYLAEFSKLKILQGQHFTDFRKIFLAQLEKIFVVPADTFDNVKGKFPIGFMIWNSKKEVVFKETNADVFDKDGEFLFKKKFIAYDDNQYINEWIKSFRANKNDINLIGKFPFMGNDFQQQNIIQINHQNMIYNKAAGQFLINASNLIYSCIYFAVRKCIEATWLNDRDQFLYPNDGWQKDSEFQNDCMAYTLFSNNIQSKFGTNHWIPFTEQEVNAKEKFESNFMTQFINGKIKQVPKKEDLFSANDDSSSAVQNTKPLVFSEKATALFQAGRELWYYYHAQPNVNVNASLYDIREYFQGRNDKGKMNNKSHDETYNQLIGTLRERLKILAKQIEPKVYEYGFLKE